MRLLVFSDLHLEAAFVGLGSAAKTRRQALRDTLLRIVELARVQKVDAVVCAGDLYEHDRIRSDTPDFVRGAFERLHPIPIYIAPGDSDWYGDTALYKRVKWSPNVHVFTRAQLEPIQLSEDVTLFGAAHQSPHDSRRFLDDFRGVMMNGVCLAVFHGDEADVVQTSGGARTYAPDLARRIKQPGVRTVFVGHRWPVDTDSCVSPGAPDPLDFDDPGRGGAVLVEISSQGVVRRERLRVATSSVHDLELDVTGCSTSAEIADRIAGVVKNLRGCVRLSLVGDLEPEVRWPSEPQAFAHLDVLLASHDRVHLRYDWESIAREETVAGQFVRDVSASTEISDAQRTGVLVAGVRALEGRDDLEV